MAARLEATEAVRLRYGVAQGSYLWAFRSAFFLVVRFTGRYWLLRSDLAGWQRRLTWFGIAGDLAATRGLIKETYPLGLRTAFEIVESAAISSGLRDHNAAAQMTVPTLMELSYRGGLRWAAPLSGIQIIGTSLLRARAGRSPNPSVYIFHSAALFAADRLVGLEVGRQQRDAQMAAVRSTEAVTSGYQAGRYAAASESIGQDEDGRPVIPHDGLTPIANYLRSSYPEERALWPALEAIGPRQQKAYLRGLSTGLLDALSTWRGEANQHRPAMDDQISAPKVDLTKGVPLLTAPQQEALLARLDALELPGGPFEVVVRGAEGYGGRMELVVNGHRVTVPPDSISFPTTATNVMRAAPQGALLAGLMELLPSQNSLPFPVGLWATVPGVTWWGRTTRSRDRSEATFLREAFLVASAHTAITAAVVRRRCPPRPDGYAPYGLSLYTPAMLVGGVWSRLSHRNKALTSGGLLAIATCGAVAVPRARALVAHAVQVGICFAAGVQFDRARTERLGELSDEATERLSLTREAAARRGRLDELDLCARACWEADAALAAGRAQEPGSEINEARIKALVDLISIRQSEVVLQAASEDDPLGEFEDLIASQRAMIAEVANA